MEPAAAPPRLRKIARHVWPDRARLRRDPLPTPYPASEGDDDPTLSAEQRAAIGARGEAAVSELVEAAMGRRGVPACSAAIVKRGAVVWARAWGWANVERRIVATTDTIFALASVTKTVTSVALMQLHEAGLVSLDEPVSTYLPFPVAHPAHPAQPITLRMLASHTAAIADTTVWMSGGRMGSGLGYAGGGPHPTLCPPSHHI